jgi:hypothetical protein
MVEIDQWSKPNIEQFAELAMGILPREFKDETELTPQARTVYAAGRRLWARPSAGNFNDGETPESFHARRLALKEKHQNGNGAGISLAIQAKEVAGRLWMRPSVSDLHFRLQGGSQAATRNLETQSRQIAASLFGLPCPTTTQDGEPFSTDTLSSFRLSPWFDEWLLLGRQMIGWTCVCPARALARAVGASLPSVTPSVLISVLLPSENSGSAPSESCHEE